MKIHALLLSATLALISIAKPTEAQMVTSYYASPTVGYYAPTTTYYAADPCRGGSASYAAPVTTYYAPTTTYYAPATTAYYAPTTTYYAPAVTAYYPPGRPGLFGWRWRSYWRNRPVATPY